MTDAADIKIPLQTLLFKLRAEGFEIGTAATLDIQRLLANVHEENVSEPAELKYLLAPIVCRNKEEQARFYKIFDDHLISVAETRLHIEGINQPKKSWKNYWWWIFIPVMGVLAWYFFDLARQTEPTPITTGIIETNDRKLNLIGDTILLEVQYADSILSKAYSTNWQIYGPGNYEKSFTKTKTINAVFDSAGTYNVLANTFNSGGKLLAADTSEVQVLCEVPPLLDIVGDAKDSTRGSFKAVINGGDKNPAYQYHWLVNDVSVPGDTVMKTSLLETNAPNTISLKVNWQDTTLHCSVDSLYKQLELQPPFQLVVSADARSPLTLNSDYNWNNIWLSLSGLLLLPLVTAGLIWWRFKKPKPTPLQHDDKTGEEKEKEGPFFIEFNNRQDRIMPEAGISQLAEVLRKRHTSDVFQLSISKTIKSTIRQGGFPKLEYVPRTQPTDFLILLDKEFPDGHLTMLFAYVIERLKKEQVHLTVYTFSREPLMLSNEGLNHVLLPIDKIARLYPDTMLLIFTQAEGFFKSYDVVLKDWVTEKFKEWNTKLILTPQAKKDWGAKEMALYDAGFSVIPADMNAYSLISDEINLMIDRNKLKKEIVPETYGSRAFNFNRWRQVTAYLHKAVEENKLRFGHMADANLVEQWLCALAVYPHINWQVTIAIGKAFEDAFSVSGKLVNYSNLLVLSRIQWMNDGQLMDSLRIEMLNNLQPDKEALARKVIVELMKEIEPVIGDDAMIKNEFDFLQTTNKVLLNAHDQQGQPLTTEEWKQFKAYVDNDQVDWTTETYLQEGQNTLLSNPDSPSDSLPLEDFMKMKASQKEEQPPTEKLIPVRSVKDLLKKVAPAAAFIIIGLFAWWLLQTNGKLQFVNQYQLADIEFNADSITAKNVQVNGLAVLLGSQLLQGVSIGNNFYQVKDVPVSDSANQLIVQISLPTGNLLSNIELKNTTYLFNIQPVKGPIETDKPGIVDLPQELNEIWSVTDSSGGIKSQMAIYLKQKLVFVKDKVGAPTQQMKLEEGGQFNQGIYKVILETNGKYEVGFFRDISSNSLKLLFCLLEKSSFDSLRDARKSNLPGCNDILDLKVLYQPVVGSKNDDKTFTIQFPQNNTTLYTSEDRVLQSAVTKWNMLSASERGKVTVSISLNGFYKFDKEVQQRQQAIRQSKLGAAFSRARWLYKPFSGNAFQRDYVTIDFSGSATPGTQADCSRTFQSMKEALSVKPEVICKLDLSNQYLNGLPKEIFSFINLQQLNISGNNISDADLKTFVGRFPKCQIINNANSNQENPIQQQEIPVKSKALDAVLKAALGEVNSTKN